MSDRPDIPRLIGDLIRFGRVASVDATAATCRVRIGDILTGDLPWLAGRAGATRHWSAPSIGEQCVVLAAEGDLEFGVVLPGLYSTAHPAPSALSELELLYFADGATIAYDPEAHQLLAELPAGGSAEIRAPAGLTIVGPVTITGTMDVSQDVTVAGKLTASDDVVGGGKSLKGHKHLGVATGGGVSGLPQ